MLVKNIQLKLFKLESKIERAENMSSGSIEDESRIDDLHYNLLKLQEQLMLPLYRSKYDRQKKTVL